MKAFDSTEVTVQCPHCRHEIRKSVGEIKARPMTTCLKCGKTFRVEGGLGMKVAQEMVQKVKQGILGLAGRASK